MSGIVSEAITNCNIGLLLQIVIRFRDEGAVSAREEKGSAEDENDAHLYYFYII